MFNVMGSIVQKRRYLLADEGDVMDVVRVIDTIKRSSKIHKVMNMEVGSCGWANEPVAWFINFDVTDAQWGKIMDMVHQQGYQIVLRRDDKLYLTRLVTKRETEE